MQIRNILNVVFRICIGSGDDGSRTRVQKTIPRSSTVIVNYLNIPAAAGEFTHLQF